MRVSIVLANWPNCAAGGSDRPIQAKFIDAEERSRRYGKINPALTLCKESLGIQWFAGDNGRMTIRLHRGDLPDISQYLGGVAIDTETMGFDGAGDRPCGDEL